jgi:hypothetical protein
MAKASASMVVAFPKFGTEPLGQVSLRAQVSPTEADNMADQIINENQKPIGLRG